MAKKKNVKSEETMLGNTRIFMERVMGGAASKAGSDAEFQAQDLYYEAMETGDMDLIFKALELDPANTDCLIQVLAAFDDTDPEGILFAQQIVKIAADRLGPELFEECKGVFWGLLETRPYMRARSELAQRLVKMGLIDEAIVEHEGMLELCQNDNLGIRYGLIGLYLQENRLKDAARLLIKFADERQYSAVMAWAYVLERFLNGKLDAATKALTAARKQNGHVEAYLKGHRKLPKNPTGSYSPGSREEAQMCAELQKPAWDAHPEAVKWLGNVMPKA